MTESDKTYRNIAFILFNCLWFATSFHLWSSSGENERGFNWLIGLVGRLFASGLGELCSIPGHVTPKTLKRVVDTSLLKTQQ